MKYGLYIFTLIALFVFLLCGHYGIRLYAKARQLKSASETMAVRARLMRRQVGELEQKVRVVKRVNAFVGKAKDQRLTPEHWSSYDVDIHDTMAYQELSHIIEQCAHNKDIYFRPISFHLTVDPNKEEMPSEKFEDIEPVPAVEDADQSQASDVSLALKGTFWVRH
jgi:uncharacterized membrane protein